MSAGRGSVRAGVARSMGPYLARYPGVDVDALLAQAGITPNMHADPNAFLSLRRWVELLERAAEVTGDPAFALSFGTQVTFADMGVLGYVALHSPTLGAAFANACRYFAVQQTGGAMALTVSGDRAELSYSVEDPALATHGQIGELVMSTCVRVAREGLGEPAWGPRLVTFRHPRPAVAEAQTRYFAPATLSWRQGQHAIVLPASDLRRPLRTADAGLLPILLRHADDCLARLPVVDDFRGEVRRHVLATLSAGEVTADEIARRLGMSPRTLQRRLAEHGQSLKELVAETRLALARRYLEDPALSLTEAAFLLGFSELSAFSRAFRRWTGHSAQEFRRKLAAGVGPAAS